MKSFITLDEALDILNNTVESLETEEIDLIQGVKRVISEDIHSKINNPPFNKSAMDGYAVIAQDTLELGTSLKVIDKVFAGKCCKNSVMSNTAIRIMTGAPIPKGANAVIKQEDVYVKGEYIEVNKSVKVNENICFKGEDINRGALLIKKNKKLDYADIGIIASSGINKIKVYKQPKIGFISTGDEVLDITEELKEGKIYNSNKYTILSRIEELGYKVSYINHIKDDSLKIAECIEEVSKNVDLIITTGGVSVGEKDLIKETIDKINGEKLFWKIKIKPGSALLCSKFNDTLIMSLSGSPMAALTTFELLVRTSLEKMSGKEKIEIKREKAILLDDFTKNSPQRRFLRGRVDYNNEKQVVNITQIKSGNGILSSSLNSNCLIDIEAGNTGIEAESIVNIIKF